MRFKANRIWLCPFQLSVLSLAMASVVNSAQAQSGLIQEITVTAQKRVQNLQSLGVAILVINAEELNARNYQDLPQATSAIANVELFEDYPSAGLPTWIIRGVGLQDFNTNNTPTASVFVDDISQTSVVMGGAGLFDVEQLEVMRGPQGGLYGRNTTGGAVLLNTRRARFDEQSGYVRINYGNWHTAGLEAAANIVLKDNLAWRVSGRILSRDDAWQSSLPTNTEHGEQQQWDFRSWLNFQASETFSIEWKIQSGADSSDIDLGRTVGVYDASGGFCAGMLGGYRDDTNCLSWAGFNQLVQSMPNTNQVNTQAVDGSRVLSSPLNEQDNDYLGNLLVLNKQFEGFNLSSS